MFSTLVSTRPEPEATSSSLITAVVLHLLVVSVLVWSSAQPKHGAPNGRPAERDITLDLLLVPEKRLHAALEGVSSSARRRAVARQHSALPTLPQLPELPAALPGAPPGIDLRDFAADWSKALDYAAAPVVAITDEAELMREPRSTHYSRAPVLANLEHVQRLLLRRFPESLRRAGGEARAILWLFINARGDVLKTVLRESSGRVEVDSVALRTGRDMRFQPAQLAGAPVPVWVQMPIRMRVQDVPIR